MRRFLTLRFFLVNVTLEASLVSIMRSNNIFSFGFTPICTLTISGTGYVPKNDVGVKCE